MRFFGSASGAWDDLTTTTTTTDQATENPTFSGAERKLDDVIVSAILAKRSDWPYPQEGEEHARNREPSTDRADVGTQQAP